MTTALEIITGAARLNGTVRKGEALSADEAADGLVALNDMLASWANHELLVISRTSESFAVSSALSYLIGVGQTLNTVRPIKIISATFTTGNIDYPLIVLTDEEYHRIDMKSQEGIPQYIVYNNANPSATIRLYPQASGTLNLLSEKPYTSFSSLSSTVDLSPGWNRALRYNLALEIAPEYDVTPAPAVVKIAGDSLNSIQLAIAKNRILRRTPPSQTDNIYSGYE